MTNKWKRAFRAWRPAVACLCGILFLGSALLNGQEPVDETARRSQLGEQQRLVERKMSELETKLTAIALQIQEKEPERAQKLIAAYQQAKEQLVTQKMAEVARLLDSNQLGPAQSKLDEVIAALEELVKLLIHQNDPGLSKQKEIEMLQQWKESIQQMQQEQKQQRQETEKVAHKEDALKQLDEQIRKLDELIKDQQQVIKETEANADKGLQALDRVADQQFDVRKRTSALKQEIQGESGKGPAADGSPMKQADPANQGTGKSPDKPAAPSDSLPPNSPPKSDKPESDSKSDKPSPAGTPPSDAPPQKSDSPNSPAGESQSPGSRSAGGSSPPGSAGKAAPQAEPPKPGQRSLEQAQQAQERAEEKLASGKAADAQRQQEKALEDLQTARQDLEKERRRIASLPPEALQQMAQTQRRTRDKALDLAKKMGEAPKPKPDPQDPDSNSTPGQKQPGQQQVQNAGDQMQKAAKDLNDQEPQPAERKQREAEKNLQQALDEIEERLNQLREETREEKLKRLEARFREMLERQKVASVMTIELHDKQTHLKKFNRRDQLLLLRLATEESEIAEIGQQTYDLLLEDGTSVVFPEVVEDLRVDLLRAGELLAQERTDPLTQLIQREIEATIQELLDALQETQKSGGGGGGGGGGGKQPLLKKSAELKMLRAAQLRVNRQTRQFDAIRSQRELDADLESEIRNIAGRQSDLLEMAERIMDNVEGDQ